MQAGEWIIKPSLKVLGSKGKAIIIPWVTKLNMAEYYYEMVCHAEKLVCHFEGHSEGLYNWNLTVSATSSKHLILLQPNLIWWYFIIGMSCGEREKKWIAAFRVKITVKVQNVIECLDDIFWTAQPFVTKLGLVIHHHEPKCLVEKLICYLQGHWEGSYNENMTAFTISSELQILLQPNLERWCSIISQRVKELNCCIQGRGHSKGSECHWMFGQMISSQLPNIMLPNLEW